MLFYILFGALALGFIAAFFYDRIAVERRAELDAKGQLSEYERRYGYQEGLAFTIPGGAAAVVVFFCGIGWLVSFTDQKNSVSEYNRIYANIEVFENRRDDLSAVINAKLEEYPELEQQVIEGIDPQILLSYPQLRSSETMIAQVEQYVSLSDSIYDSKVELNSIDAAVERRRNGALIPGWMIPDVTIEAPVDAD